MQPQPQILPPTPPLPPGAPVMPGPPGMEIIQIAPGAAGSPTEVLIGFREQRSEIANQLEELEERREEIAQQLQDPEMAGANRTGLEQRLAGLDQRILATEQALEVANARVAQAAAVPGAVVQDPPPPPEMFDEDVVGMSLLFAFFILFPMVVAYSRRLWKRAAVITAIPSELYDRLSRIEQSVDTVALEVERIGEGQRFVTQVLASRRESPALSEVERR